MSTRSRRVKWHTPPSPKIINLPRTHTTRRKKTRTTLTKQPTTTYNYKGKLSSLFGEERQFTRAEPTTTTTYNYKGKLASLFGEERRERVEAEEDGGGHLAEERWRFQAEILRAECNFLRMERKFALKKLERNRVRIERTLKSALQNLASGRKKLCEGKNMELVLEEEMKELAEKLQELQTSYNGNEDRELRKCRNFDKKAARLQRRLEKLGRLTDDECNKEIKNEAGLPEDSSILDCKSQNKSTDVEMLERKMEGISMGMLDRMEKEYGSILNSSAASSASFSKRIDFPNYVSFSNRYTNYTKESSTSNEANNKCSGRCKVLVRRIVEQVRAETEQWSQMQEMLGQLRQEMEELQTSKDFWETQALASNNEIQSLQSDVEEWRSKAIEYEIKANKLQGDVDLMKGDLEKLKKGQDLPKKPMLSLGKQLEKETKNGSSFRMKGKCDIIGEKVEQNKKDSQPLSLGKQLAREKRILVSRLKENRASNNEVSGEGRRKGYNLVRSPFKDIGNSLSSSMTLGRQNSNAIYPLHCLEPARMEESS